MQMYETYLPILRMSECVGILPQPPDPHAKANVFD